MIPTGWIPMEILSKSWMKQSRHMIIEKLKNKMTGNLLGWYIESFAEAKDDSVESIALAEGVQAMLEAKGSKL